MSEREIYLSYIQAKNRKGQVEILADLNDCSKRQIREVIDRQQGLREPEKPQIETSEIEARLDILDALISKFTSEYIALSKVLGAING